MRQINTKKITKVVSKLYVDANFYLPKDVLRALKIALGKEKSPLGIEVLKQLIENVNIASKKRIPICQDTGYPVVFIEIGQNVKIIGGNLYDAINEGIRQGVKKGYLRSSVLNDPIERKNTGDNTPAVIHTEIVSGNRLKIIIVPKGGGSENMSGLTMLKPSDGIEGIKHFVIEQVKKAGANPCPPIIVGVGLGGTFEKAALLSKKALLRPLGKFNKNRRYAELEKELLVKINNLGIGPEGFGGRVTALAVNIEAFPCHIASLPVAVNIQCHVARHKKIII